MRGEMLIQYRKGKEGQKKDWQGRAGQDRVGQGRAGQGRAGQGRAGQGRAGQGRAGQGIIRGRPTLVGYRVCTLCPSCPCSHYRDRTGCSPRSG